METRHWTDSPTKVLGLVAAVLSVVTGALALLAQVGAFGDFRIPFLPGRPAGAQTSISLSKGEGPSGTPIVVTGHGFAGEEEVEVRFHTEVIAIARTDQDGNFSANATVPGSFDVFGTQQYDIVALGKSSVAHANTPFRLVSGGGSKPDDGGFDQRAPASISLSKGSGKSGTQITVSGQGFKPGEEVVISFHTEQIGTALVGADGRFSQQVRIPGSFDVFAPQQFLVRANGNTSIKHADRPFQLTK